MQSIYNFIIKPKNKRYNNTKQIGEKEYEDFFVFPKSLVILATR